MQTFPGWAWNRIKLLQTFYDNVSVKQIDVRSTTGAFGILPHHVPSIAVLQPGLVKVYESDKTQNYFGEWCTAWGWFPHSTVMYSYCSQQWYSHYQCWWHSSDFGRRGLPSRHVGFTGTCAHHMTVTWSDICLINVSRKLDRVLRNVSRHDLQQPATQSVQRLTLA